MKLEFLSDIDHGGGHPDAYPRQLIRLYDFSSFEANLLRQHILTEIIESKNEIDLPSLYFITSVNCGLTLCVADDDEGITTLDSSHFVCNLTMQGYKEMIFLMGPFCYKNIGGYQWLYEWRATHSEIEFLFSPYGSW
jgi:hypothetical protein